MMANERKVSASTHNQALSAVLFLYREVLDIDLPWLDNIGRPQQTKRIPSVLTKDEVARLFTQMEGTPALLARLLYGTGMRLMEGMRLRIKDVDFDRHVIIVREAKGSKDRVVMLPRTLAPAVHAQLLAARGTWEADKQAQRAGLEVPHALEAKYPKVGQTWGWFWLFPSPTLSVDPHSGVERRHHLFEERLQRALKKPDTQAPNRQFAQAVRVSQAIKLIAIVASHCTTATRPPAEKPEEVRGATPRSARARLFPLACAGRRGNRAQC